MGMDVWTPSKLSDLTDVDPSLDESHDKYGFLFDTASGTWKAVVSPTSTLTTKGDLLYASAANALARLPIGTTNQFLANALGVPAWAQPDFSNLSGYPTITLSETQLGADVTLTNADQFYDGVSLSLGIGTWLVDVCVTVTATANTAADNTAKLWDGTTVYASCQGRTNALTNAGASLSMTKKITLASTTTIKVSVACHTAAVAKIGAAAGFNGAGNNATTMTALKVAS